MDNTTAASTTTTLIPIWIFYKAALTYFGISDFLPSSAQIHLHPSTAYRISALLVVLLPATLLVSLLALLYQMQKRYEKEQQQQREEEEEEEQNQLQHKNDEQRNGASTTTHNDDENENDNNNDEQRERRRRQRRSPSSSSSSSSLGGGGGGCGALIRRIPHKVRFGFCLCLRLALLLLWIRYLARCKKYATGWYEHQLEADEVALRTFERGLAKRRIVEVLQGRPQASGDEPSFDVYLPKPQPSKKSSSCRVYDMGLIFFPGALLSRKSYASVALKLSTAVDAVVVVWNHDGAGRIMASHLGATPAALKSLVRRLETNHSLAVREWALGGHSMGGQTAAQLQPHVTLPTVAVSSSKKKKGGVATDDSSGIRKLVLWGCYGFSSVPEKSRYIRGNDTAVLVVTATEDAYLFSSSREREDFASRLPPPAWPVEVSLRRNDTTAGSSTATTTTKKRTTKAPPPKSASSSPQQQHEVSYQRNVLNFTHLLAHYHHHRRRQDDDEAKKIKKKMKNKKKNAEDEEEEEEEEDRSATFWYAIEGGNHAGFGNYGPQNYPRPDGVRRGITLKEQHEQLIQVTAAFLLQQQQQQNELSS